MSVIIKFDNALHSELLFSKKLKYVMVVMVISLKLIKFLDANYSKVKPFFYFNRYLYFSFGISWYERIQKTGWKMPGNEVPEKE